MSGNNPMLKIRFLLAIVIWAIPLLAHSQSDRFATAISVNGIPISNYEISQRAVMLKALSIRGDLREQAERDLIDDRLYLSEARRLGIFLSEQEISAGIEEYASRANMSPESFLAELTSEGVDPETFRAFIQAGLLWRQVVSALYSGKVTNITQNEIDSALQFDPGVTTEFVLLSEIVIVLDPDLASAQRTLARQVYESARTLSQFREAATAVSQAPSRVRGGDLGWLPISALPPRLQAAVRAAPSGAAIPPVVSQNQIYIIFKRGTRTENPFRDAEAIDYATLQIRTKSRKRSDAVAIANQIMERSPNCTQMLLATQNWPKGAFKRQTSKFVELDERYAAEISVLDNAEFAILPGKTNGAIELLMLCRRVFGPQESTEERDAVFTKLRDRKLEAYARVHLERLRSNAIIER